MKTLTAFLVMLMLSAAPAVAAQDHAPAPAATPAAQEPHATPAAQPPHAPAADAAQPAEAAEEEEAEAAEGGIVQTIAKLFNFFLLIALLVHFGRRPIANYLVDRDQQIRHALVEAKATREAASADLGRIESRLAALPAELEALKARGAEEVAMEQARIKALAATERERVLAQTRREIDQQYRLARRELMQETAEQAAAVARARIERDITPADQTRLIDRYVQQVRA
jgi:F-type H+-transporting ATPase subunit b